MAGNFLPAGNYRPREPADAGAALDDALAAMAWAIEDEGRAPPALDQVRSANQAESNQPVEGQCHREFVPTALPRCWLAGQSGHAGHGVRWIDGDLSTKVNSPPTCGR